jgi:hypothetical protein
MKWRESTLVQKLTTFEGLITFLGSRILLSNWRPTLRHMERTLANMKIQEQFVELLELASKERDQDNVGAIFEDILRLLEEKQRSLTAPC